ncbi:MAG: hypothetical protein AAGI50_10235 [Pseudomonadota bacterium]
MKRTLIAVTTAAALSFAGATTAVAMGEQLTMLEAAIDSEFQRLGIQDIGMGDLTLGQLALIKNVIESEDNTQEKRRRIMAIVDR